MNTAGARAIRCLLDPEHDVEQIRRSEVIVEKARRVAVDLMTDGLTILRNAVSPEVCEAVIEDYYRWVGQNMAYRNQNLDDLGREKRLVNFHRWSQPAMSIATNAETMQILDVIFGAESYVYTSLTFKYGTQQPIHRDTPHFATWPARRFVGVWTALEDVNSDAGPLMFSRGAQKFAVDQYNIFRSVEREFPTLTRQEQLDRALDIYNGVIITKAPLEGEIKLVEPLRRGDTVIWHPELPHGGSPAVDPMKSRWSIVVHCASSEVQVHQHGSFFGHNGNEPPADRYGFISSSGRKVANAGVVAYM
jgi:phytanoyl-CoA hydroxylase